MHVELILVQSDPRNTFIISISALNKRGRKNFAALQELIIYT